jgi:DNA-binding transcriptional regulator YbjK
MSTDRKTLIADAALALLASVGARGLTHRAVDAQAGLPVGSTSFYCRTRLDLLALALGRHAALDLADLEADAARWMRVVQQPDAGTPQARQALLHAFVEALADRIADWVSPAQRVRLIARVELFLIASREPALKALIQVQRQRFLDATEAALRHIGLPQPAALASALVMTVDGMLLAQVACDGTPLTPQGCRAMLQRALSVAG